MFLSITSAISDRKSISAFISITVLLEFYVKEMGEQPRPAAVQCCFCKYLQNHLFVLYLVNTMVVFSSLFVFFVFCFYYLSPEGLPLLNICMVEKEGGGGEEIHNTIVLFHECSFVDICKIMKGINIVVISGG